MIMEFRHNVSQLKCFFLITVTDFRYNTLRILNILYFDIKCYVYASANIESYLLKNRKLFTQYKKSNFIA